MILYNPTNKEVSIVFEGIRYGVGPESNTEELGKDVANYWLNTHQFLRVVVKEVESAEKQTKTVKKTKDAGDVVTGKE